LLGVSVEAPPEPPPVILEAAAPPLPPAPPVLQRPKLPLKKKNPETGPSFLARWKKPAAVAAAMASLVLLSWRLLVPGFGKPRAAVIPAAGKAFFEEAPMPGATVVLEPVAAREAGFPRPNGVVKEDGS